MQVLDFFMEFEFLNDYKNANISSEINDDIGKMKKFLPIEEGKKILGNDKAIFMFAELKYIIADKSKLTIRCILTLLFYTGIILLYLPVTEAIYNILIHHR